jgi:hypothetical protein
LIHHRSGVVTVVSAAGIALTSAFVRPFGHWIALTARMSVTQD